MEEMLTRCAEELFCDFVQSPEYIRKYNEVLKQRKGLAECKKTVDDFLHQLWDKEGFSKFTALDEAIEGQKCELERFGFINGFMFAAQLLGK